MSEGKLRSGISMQYGHKGERSPSGRANSESVWFNFTILDNGEVQIRTHDNTIIMSKNAYLALFGLYSDAVDKFRWDLKASVSEYQEYLTQKLRTIDAKYQQ